MHWRLSEGGLGQSICCVDTVHVLKVHLLSFLKSFKLASYVVVMLLSFENFFMFFFMFFLVL